MVADDHGRESLGCYGNPDEPFPGEIVNLAVKDEYYQLVSLFCEEIKAFQHETRGSRIHKWEYE